MVLVMKITRTSILSKITRTMDLDITDFDISIFNDGELIQKAFPHLTPSQREFFLTGITDEEWNAHFCENPHYKMGNE